MPFMPSSPDAQSEGAGHDGFKIIPAMHVYRKYAATPNLKRLEKTPEELASLFSQTSALVYLADCCGILKDKPDIDLLKKLARFKIWVDAGSKSAEDMIDLFVSGAQYVTLRVNKLSSREELQECCKMSGEQLYLGLEKKDGKLTMAFFSGLGDIQDFIERYGLGGLVFIDRDRAGFLSGVDIDAVKKISVLRTSVYYAGGIRTKRDIEFLKENGAAGAIIGTAHYNELAKKLI